MAGKGFSWLGALPGIRVALASDGDAGLAELRDLLLREPLQGFELELIGRLLGEVAGVGGTTFPTFRVALLADTTSEPLANALRVALLREGFMAQVREAAFGTYRQEILDAGSDLYASACDAVLIAVSADEGASIPMGFLSDQEVRERLDRDLADWEVLWRRLHEGLGKPVFQHVLEGPDQALLGIAERRSAWTAARYVDALNAALLEAAPGFVRWVDVDSLAARVGRQNWRDLRLHYHGRFAFASRYLPEYARLLAAAMRPVLGNAKKALILDLDNTLWGGVIGDDRLEGIRLGPDTPEGAAYEGFARYVKQLGQRGVVLGICSKNEHEIAMEVLREHPHMPLGMEDFAAIRCNWRDKATNLQEIAAELNIDLSALVLVDDNPAECELIRQSLPQVRTVLLDGDPALFARRLDQEHLFDTQVLSQEDLRRTESYRARSQSRALEAAAPDLDSYLESLEMTCHLRDAEPKDLPRLAQMELKTNQFNLSTRRLSLEALDEMSKSPRTFLWVASLADRFAEHGLVSYLAGDMEDDSIVITDWLMSCRVFSRTLEQFVFNALVRHAAARGAKQIRAVLSPTAKNKVMNGLFGSLGFSCAGEAPRGPWVYTVVNDQEPLGTFIAPASSIPQGTVR